MDVKLAYGKSGLHLSIPDNWHTHVIEPNYPPALSDPERQLRNALEQPVGAPRLRDLVKPTDRIGIIVNDITRATPNPLILHVIIEHLSHIPLENIRIFVALGTHRRMTPAELSELVGAEIFATFPVIQNDAFNLHSQTFLGYTHQGHKIWINSELMACDVKILTGFIEPHFFAGFSGAGKAIMPGMAGIQTILGNHCAANIADLNATWGRTHGNPIWEEIQEVAHKVPSTFLVNVTLDRERKITGIFSGDLDAAYAKGVDFVRQYAMVAVDEPFDIVITSNSGYPLDLNLYQSVKGMSAASQIVKPGGAIFIAASCWDGIPDHGQFKELLEGAGDPVNLLKKVMKPDCCIQDQWQAQILAQVLTKARVYLFSDHLTDTEIHSALLTPTTDIAKTIHEMMISFSHPVRICVLPEGPLTIPVIKETSRLSN